MSAPNIITHNSRELVNGAVLRRREMHFKRHGSCQVCRPVGPDNGATQVAVEVVRIPAGGQWSPGYRDEENTVVVFAGTGGAHVGEDVTRLERAAAVYAPTGCDLEAWADRSGEMILYVWRSLISTNGIAGSAPRTVSSLWNAETQLVGFTGTGELPPSDRPATMNFVFWPGTGSPCLCLHCGIQQPGETFNVHIHEASEDAFIAFEGVGQMYLADRWVDVEAGDLLFAPPFVPHGARNPNTGPSARRFVACGGPTPFDPVLYDAAGVSTEVV
jgi:quercetin dioxygenase-like cupin family protein